MFSYCIFILILSNSNADESTLLQTTSTTANYDVDLELFVEHFRNFWELKASRLFLLKVSILKLTISQEKYDNGFQLYPVQNLTALCKNGFMQKCVNFTLNDFGDCQPDGWSSTDIVWYDKRVYFFHWTPGHIDIIPI